MLLSHASQTRQIKFTKHIDESETKHFSSLFGDERRFLQILVNFLSNAIKFSGPGQSIEVECKLNQSATKVVKNFSSVKAGDMSVLLNKNSTHYVNFDIIVRDFGCGISHENIDKLFINFNKLAENANLNSHGVGLGLSICKLLIEQMGGTVTVASELGRGTTFTLNFKLSCALEKPEKKILGFKSYLSIVDEIPEGELDD